MARFTKAWPSCNLAPNLPRLLKISAPLVLICLGGCSWMHPDARYALHKNWENFKNYDWVDNAKDVTGWREAFPTATESERLASRMACLHPNGENRIVTQDGITDSVGYRRCVLDPYPEGRNAPGLRLDGRGGPQG